MTTDGCLHCGTALTDLKSRGRRKRYCNSTCRSAARRVRVTGRPDRPGSDFARELDDALDGCVHSGRHLVRRLDEDGYNISAGALSQWRNGISRPRRNADARDRLLALERIIPTPPGRLLVALDRSTRAEGSCRSRDGAPVRLSGGPADNRMRLERRIERTRAGNRGRATLVVQRETYRIGLDRKPVRTDVDYVLCALQAGVDRYWAVYTDETAAPVDPEPSAGCRLGQTMREPDGGYPVAATELILDRPLAAGELYPFGFALVNRSDPDDLTLPRTEYGRVLLDPGCRELSLRVCFDPGQLPVLVRQVTWTRDAVGAPEPTTQRVVPLADRAVELALTNPPPGAYGFRWTWVGSKQAVPVSRERRR